MLTDVKVESLLVDRLSQIEDPPEGTQAATSPTALARIKSDILGRFAEFLADYVELLPPRDAVLEALSKSIDKVFTAVNRPFLTSLLGPAAKRLILDAAGKLYDSIVSPRTEV